MNDIIYIKLFTGDDIVATLVEESEDLLFISHPLKFVYTSSQTTGNMSIGFIRWVPVEELMESVLEIYKGNIILVCEVPEHMKILYCKLNNIDDSGESVENKFSNMIEDIGKNPDLGKLLFANTESKLLH